MPFSEADTRGWKEDNIKREETAGVVEMHDGKAGKLEYACIVSCHLSSKPFAFSSSASNKLRIEEKADMFEFSTY